MTNNFRSSSKYVELGKGWSENGQRVSEIALSE